MALPELALSINQPWAWLIAAGLKPIENRNWNTTFRGEFLIHAGQKVDRDALLDVLDDKHPVTGEERMFSRTMATEKAPTGGMVGIAEVYDVIRGRGDLKHRKDVDDSWFVGRYGLLIRNARPIEFIPCVGALGFFTPNYDLQYKPKPEKAPRPAKAQPEAVAAAQDLFG